METESETLILKRLESALANENNSLLKIASYKLHEKFHSGYKFEYTSQLKKISDYIKTQNCFDEEIVTLLVSTIDEILYPKDENMISNNSKEVDVKTVIDSILPSSNTFSNDYSSKTEVEEDRSLAAYDYLDSEKENNQEKYQNTYKKDEIAVFYEEKISDINNSLVKKINTVLLKGEDFNKTADELKNFINLAEGDLSGLENLLLTIKNSGKNIHFATVSRNGKLLDVFKNAGINLGENWNFYPLLGLTRLLKCTSCDEEILNTTSIKVPFTYCDNCSDIMLPKLKADNEFDTYTFQYALKSFMESSCWVLINPPNNQESAVIKMFSVALINNKPNFVYLLTQSEEKIEFYKDFFKKYNIEIKSDFPNTERFSREF